MKKCAFHFGCGVNYSDELDSFILNNKEQIDFIEIFADVLRSSSRSKKERLAWLKDLSLKFKMVVHGIHLSIASEKINQEYLREVKQLCDTVDAPYYSDHLALTRVSDINLRNLSPMLFSDSMLERVIRNVNHVQDYLERPILLENIAYHLILNDSPYIEAEFLNTVINETKCGMLLDLANLHANSLNHNFDPYLYIDKLNKEKIVQFHIAGGNYGQSGYLYDTHSNLIEEETWRLLGYALVNSSQSNILIEHDQDFLSNDYFLEQLKLAKKMSYVSAEKNISR